MAEFKLGRIRFVWKGAWFTGNEYFIDDVVRYGGRTYIGIKGHTATSDFQADLTANYWALMSDGQEWKGDWNVNITYKPNDVVKYGGYIYLCNTGHTSAELVADGLEADQSKWDLFSEGFNYLGNWAISTRYKINDLVKYGESVYLCTTQHTSSATTAGGLEGDDGAGNQTDLAKWELFAKGFGWNNAWTTATRYKPNDTVRYGGQVYICILGHTSASTASDGLETDQAKWQYVHKGIEYKGDWAGTTRYKVNDLVKYGGNIWICTTHHTSTTSLATDEANWSIFVPGLEFEDSWSSATQYQPGDFSTYGGYSYVAKTNNLNKQPSQYPADWDLFVTGFSLKGDYDNATAYKTGDVVRVGGFTYLNIEDSTGNRPPNVTYWNKLNEGLYWKGNWANAAYYDKGDIVRGTINTDTSYICIQSHTANNVGPSTINQPDYAPGAGVDSGSYWQLLSGGPENDVISAQGDLLVYGPSGPARLPIGRAGQSLVVNEAGTLPEWGYVGQVDQVYYVANGGQDLPAPDAGVTLDRPWKNVRYGLYNIENGPRYPFTTFLLERNKQFIQDEIIAWINDQVANNVTPFTNAFTYNATKCRRDIGILIDATLWDMKHGGNERSRKAALQYFTPAGASYVTGQTAETAASIVRAIYIAQQVIANNTGYTAEQATTPQFADATYVAESDGGTLIETLMKYSSDAITAGDSTGVPALRIANTTLFVKTGRYQEVCPMIIDESVALVGDELRSTGIAPAGSLTPAGDVQYSLQGVDRMIAILSDVVQNNAVTPTPSGGVISIDNDSGASLSFNDGTGTGVTSTTTGSGAGATFDITVASFSVTTITVNNPGQGYATDDRITIPAGTVIVGGGGNTTLGADFSFDANEVTTGNIITQSVTAPAGSAAAATAAVTYATDIKEYIDFKINAVGTEPTMIGSNIAELDAGYTDARGKILANKDFIAKEAAEYVKRANPTITFSQTACERDIKEYVDSILDGLQYTGNYKALRSAEWYVNSVQGSTTKDMFYMRNGSGLRNCSLSGLSGTLSTANAYGTKRPTAGAFVSLDPGFGPLDYKAWIATTTAGTQQFTPGTGTSYDPATGTTVLAIGTHKLQPGDTVRLTTSSLTFSCTQDGNVSQIAYPRTTDPAAGKELLVEAVTPTSITINVGASAPGSQYPHTFISATANSVQEETINRIGGKSPYVQNVSNFGTGATGLKIDGDLHAGGNDSIVANDFTQIISDGIGAWVTNLGRSELVSVFAYYNHIGYLAETGGKIRATNGNNSYGDHGSVAEGVDPTEVAVTGRVDNRSTDALVDAVFTNGDQVLALEYGNAGTEYSNANISIAGTGYGLTVNSATYNTGGIYKIRLTETPGSDPSDLGGAGYVSATNASQTGDTVSITIAVTDTNPSNAYIGMAVWVVEGLGAGQYGYIDTYNAASKVATVRKYSDGTPGWDHLLGDSSVSSYLDATSIYSIEPRVSIPAPQNDGSTAPRQAIARAVVTAEQISSIKILDCGASYTNAPTITIVDPSNTTDAPITAYVGDGVLGQPTFTSRGFEYETADATVTETGTQATVSGATQANPCVITTSAAHNFNDNDKVVFTDVGGMIELNTGVYYYIKVLTTDTFEVYSDFQLTEGIDSTNYTVYSVSNGKATAFGGFRDEYQSGKYIQVENLTELPRAGSNVEFGHLPNQFFKLVAVNQQLGTQAPFTGLLQISPDLKVSESPEHGQALEMRIRYSQVRLTGHDFLDIGTGNQTNTNYPGVPLQDPDPTKECVESNGGRVFFTSTDQDGNFRVGDLFSVEQATGIATLNADAFNISGLQELQLGDLALGGTSASINEFSTDGTMSANSDAIVPTQRAIRTYIASQIGGGASSLNVNLIVAGFVVITGQEISTTTDTGINMNSTVNFKKGVSGVPVAMNYLIHS